MGPQIRGIFNVHLKMSLEGKEKLGLKVEKEGGMVMASTKPVDDRINDPKSVSENENNLSLI